MKNEIVREFRFIDPRSLFFAAIFTIFFLAWEIAVFKVGYFWYFFHTFTSVNIRYFLFLQANVFISILLISFFFYSAIISSKYIKTLALTLFATILFYEYGYRNALGRYSTHIDLEVALFMTNYEQKLGAIASYLNWLALIPIVLFGVLIFAQKRPHVFGRHYIFVLSLVITIGYYAVFGSIFRNHLFSPTFPLVSTHNFFENVIKLSPGWIIGYNGTREEVDTPVIKTAKPTNNIIFVTDESVRADNFSLNGYERNTTPFLITLFKSGKLKNFGTCVSGSTCSTSSAALLLTGVKIEDLPDSDNKLKRLPSIYQYAKAMGYKVHFIDGQMSHFWNGPYRDQKYVDNWRKSDDFARRANNPYEIDFEIAAEVSDIIKNSGGNFIWVWKRGLHFPYDDDFPDDKVKWKPISNSSYLGSVPREHLINTYDNAIKYNIDGFFKILAPEIEKNERNVLVYTSDHGQNLLDNPNYGTHCMETKGEASVPLFMLGNFKSKNSSTFRATHANIFATLLDLMKVPKKIRKYEYSSSLLNPDAPSPAHRYFWGQDLTIGKKTKFD